MASRTVSPLEVAILLAACGALLLIAVRFAGTLESTLPPCSGQGTELAGTCVGDNPGHVAG